MTEHLYILGHPVAHSKSPAMYNAVYGAMGLDWDYGFADIDDAAAAERFVREDAFLSVNVTTPWKPLAFKIANVPAASARLAGGANVLVRAADQLLAYNVDGQGCVDYLMREGARIADAKVTICGTGPTAVSIMNECVQAGAQRVLMLGRNKDRAQATVDGYLETYRELLSTAVMLPGAAPGRLDFSEAYQHAQLMFGSYDTSKQALAASDTIIDATPLGMKADDPAPFDTSLIHEGQVVFDTVYGHGLTSLLRAARDAGARALDGRGMLVAQAVATAGIVCDVAGIDMPYDPDRLFDMMAQAAGFQFDQKERACTM